MITPVEVFVEAFCLGSAACATVGFVFYEHGFRKGKAEGIKFKNWFQGRASEGEGQTQSASTQGSVGQLGGINRAQNPYWQNPTMAQNAQGPNQQQLQQQMQAALNQLNQKP